MRFRVCHRLCRETFRGRVRGVSLACGFVQAEQRQFIPRVKDSFSCHTPVCTSGDPAAEMRNTSQQTAHPLGFRYLEGCEEPVACAWGPGSCDTCK